jgi:hypothetical protein
MKTLQRTTKKLRIDDIIAQSFCILGDTVTSLWSGRVSRTNPTYVRYTDETGRDQGTFMFPNPYICTKRLAIRAQPDDDSRLDSSITAGLRLHIRYERQGNVRIWSGSIIAVLSQRRHCVVRYDGSKINMLFPPPKHSGVRIVNWKVSPRTPVETTALRQQRLRYRRAASYVAHVLAPPAPEPPESETGLEVHVSQNHENPHNSHHPSPDRHHHITNVTPAIAPREYCKRGLRLATLNARTMSDEYRWHRLFAYMHHRGIDALAVQETRCIATPEISIHGFNVHHTDATPEGHYGCALILGPRMQSLASDVIHKHRTVKCCVKATLGSLVKHYTLVAAYFPQKDADDREQYVDEIIHACHSPDTILLCDANGAVDELTHRADLRSCAQLTGHNKWTWKRNLSKSIIDHVMVKKSEARTAISVSYESPLISDHRMVTATLRPKWTLEKAKAKPTLQLHDLAYDGKARAQFNDQYKPSLNKSLTTLKAALENVKGKWYKRQHPVNMPWDSAAPRTAVLTTSDNAEAILELADHNWATAHIDEYVQHLAQNPWTAWKHIHQLQRQHAQVAGAVTAEQLRQQFKNSMEAPTDPPTPNVPTMRTTLINIIDDSDFTLTELKRALGTMKGHTACGPDGIPIEAYRCPKVQQDLLAILNSMLDTEELPPELTKGLLTPVYKRKGSARDPLNYRPIVLLSVALKILHKLILLRLRDTIDPHLIPCQAAYREGHATTMNMATLHELGEHSRTSKNTPLYEVFTDFSAAFDSVFRPHLFTLLRKWNVPERFVLFLERSHAQQVLNVRYDGTVDEVGIKPTRGVMQGDTLAPYLFILVIDQILRCLPTECGALVHSERSTARMGNMDIRIPALAYADDVVLLANDAASAQRLLVAFESAALDWGLKLNTKKGKTELLLISTPELRKTLPTEPLVCKAGTVLETSSYKYLGWHVSNSTKNTWREDLDKRVGHAWGILRQYDRVWNSHASSETKKKLFQALILPVLMYAALTYPLTATVLTRLQVTTNKLMRAALSLRVDWDEKALHTHTEELYSHFAFTPVQLVRQFVVQWGHWCRAAHRSTFHHPIIDAFLGDFNHVRHTRGTRHPPSKWLLAATGCTVDELWTLPPDRAAWSRLCSQRTYAMAQDFCDTVVTSRRLDDDRPPPHWKSLIDHWFDESRSTRRKGFF